MIFSVQAVKSIPKQDSTQVCAYIFSLLSILGIGWVLLTCCSGSGSEMPPCSIDDSLQVFGRISFLADHFCKYMLNISRSTLKVNVFYEKLPWAE